jgi:dTDP-4-dehydrorhamnose reductase
MAPVRLAIVGDGLLGRTLFSHRISEGKDGDVSILWDHNEIDLTSHSSIRAALNLRRPDVVINTAAFHSVVECERDPVRAYDVNARGAERLAELVRTVYISSDYVFNDGGPHDESLPGRQPRSIYGRSKLGGEIGTLEQGGVVVRVAGLFGHYPSHKGPTFPEMILSSHDPIRLPTDQRFSPTYAPDAAARILAIALNPKAEGIYHATNKGDVSWAEWGEEILAYVHHDRPILPGRARDPIRPLNSVLKSTRLPQLPHWKDALGRWAQREGRYTVVSPKRES